MKLIVQRVREASVYEHNSQLGSISKGLLVYAGFSDDMNEEKLEYAVRKLTRLRLWPSQAKGFDLSVREVEGAILLVSQFTLQGVVDGNKPDFKRAASYEKGLYWYERLCDSLRETGIMLETGRFGADMQVYACNDGPVTILLER
jgi:D-tyrosyl-tRNA(Tyr) deacylase